MIKNVFFDLGGTLSYLPGVPEFNRALKSELGPERYGVVLEYFVQAHRQPMEEDEWVRTVAEKIGATPEQEKKLRKKIHWPEYEVAEDALPILRFVKDRGMKLGLISNAPVWIRAVLGKSPMYDYFDDVVISCEVGLMKPQEEIFELALRRMDCKAGESLMVGDDPRSDVWGAENAGMKGILLDRDGSKDHPGKKIASLTELRDLLN